MYESFISVTVECKLLCLSVQKIGKQMHLFSPTLVQIGSSPGFEDGEFECAKLMCPAASFYNAAAGCLYFVDSEVRTYYFCSITAHGS